MYSIFRGSFEYFLEIFASLPEMTSTFPPLACNSLLISNTCFAYFLLVNYLSSVGNNVICLIWSTYKSLRRVSWFILFFLFFWSQEYILVGLVSVFSNFIIFRMKEGKEGRVMRLIYLNIGDYKRRWDKPFWDIENREKSSN